MSDENKEDARTCPNCFTEVIPNEHCPRCGLFIREIPSRKVESQAPRQNELLPCPHVWREADDLIICKLPGMEEFGISNEGAKMLRDQLMIVAPLSDDVKAVKKEVDSGLKEALSDTTHVLQNALSVLLRHAGWERNYAEDGSELPMSRPGDVQLVEAQIQAILSSHDGKQGADQVNQTPSVAAPVTPKSEEELENETPIASKASNIATQNAQTPNSTNE